MHQDDKSFICDRNDSVTDLAVCMNTKEKKYVLSDELWIIFSGNARNFKGNLTTAIYEYYTDLVITC